MIIWKSKPTILRARWDPELPMGKIFYELVFSDLVKNSKNCKTSKNAQNDSSLLPKTWLRANIFVNLVKIYETSISHSFSYFFVSKKVQLQKWELFEIAQRILIHLFSFRFINSCSKHQWCKYMIGLFLCYSSIVLYSNFHFSFSTSRYGEKQEK